MPDIPVHIVKPAARFENLVVPGQGLGLGTISTGTPELRHSFNSRLCAAVEPSGPAKLYVSRSKLSPQSSGILGETTLETQLSNDGYTIFHPQDHSLRSQIAHYRGAEKIIIADGSAGHLVALVCRPDQKIAYIVRRSDWSEGPITQIESFRQKPILTSIPCLARRRFSGRIKHMARFDPSRCRGCLGRRRNSGRFQSSFNVICGRALFPFPQVPHQTNPAGPKSGC